MSHIALIQSLFATATGIVSIILGRKYRSGNKTVRILLCLLAGVLVVADLVIAYLR
jgi:hypothetical protein